MVLVVLWIELDRFVVVVVGGAVGGGGVVQYDVAVKLFEQRNCHQ